MLITCDDHSTKLAFQICHFVEIQLGQQPTSEEEYVKNMMYKRNNLQSQRNLAQEIEDLMLRKKKIVGKILQDDQIIVWRLIKIYTHNLFIAEKKQKLTKSLEEQDRYNRHNLKPKERKMMISLLYKPDENGHPTRKTVPVSDILELAESNDKFGAMFKRVAGLLKKTDLEMAKTMKASYREYWRKKIEKNKELVLSADEDEEEK